MKKKVTLHDIADEAGTHISTVSKALRNSSDINGETRERILSIAKKRGYPVNPQRIMQVNPHVPLNRQTVGVVCPEIKSNYYAQLVDSIDHHCREAGFTLNFAFSNFSSADELHHLQCFLRAGIDGVIFITESRTFSSTKLFAAQEKNLPFITIAPEPLFPDRDFIMIDDSLGVSRAVKHLIGLKHSRIGYIGDLLSEERHAVFRKTLREEGIPVEKDFIAVREDRFEECGYRGIQDILGRRRRPGAVLCAYDDIAVGALRGLQEAGIGVPGDISVIGIDNIQVSSYLHTSLTTVGCPLQELGRIAAGMLSEKTNNPESTLIQHITLKPVLIERESTGPPPAGSG